MLSHRRRLDNWVTVTKTWPDGRSTAWLISVWEGSIELWVRPGEMEMDDESTATITTDCIRVADNPAIAIKDWRSALRRLLNEILVADYGTSIEISVRGEKKKFDRALTPFIVSQLVTFPPGPDSFRTEPPSVQTVWSGNWSSNFMDRLPVPLLERSVILRHKSGTFSIACLIPTQPDVAGLPLLLERRGEAFQLIIDANDNGERILSSHFSELDIGPTYSTGFGDAVHFHEPITNAYLLLKVSDDVAVHVSATMDSHLFDATSEAKIEAGIGKVVLVSSLDREIDAIARFIEETHLRSYAMHGDLTPNPTAYSEAELRLWSKALAQGQFEGTPRTREAEERRALIDERLAEISPEFAQFRRILRTPTESDKAFALKVLAMEHHSDNEFEVREGVLGLLWSGPGAA